MRFSIIRAKYECKNLLKGQYIPSFDRIFDRRVWLTMINNRVLLTLYESIRKLKVLDKLAIIHNK